MDNGAVLWLQGTQEIDPTEIELCLLEDGRPWLLGSGSFGQARFVPSSAGLDCMGRSSQSNDRVLLFAAATGHL